MIVLDTHIWVWWVHGDRRLRASSLDLLKENETSGLGVSIISCWEVAKLVEYKRLDLPALVDEWIEQAPIARSWTMTASKPSTCAPSPQGRPFR